MTLIKTSILNGMAVMVKLLTFLGINKLLSLYVGPVGYAFLGQYQNLITVITTFASGAITTGVTKYTAEYYYDEHQQHVLWQTAAKIALIGSVITAFFLAYFSQYLAVLFLHDKNLAGTFLWFAGTLVLFVLNALLLAILNGKKEIGLYIIANISGSVLALIISAILIIYQGLYGALIALAVYQSVAFFVTCILCYNRPWFQFSFLLGHMDKRIAKNLFRYALMAIISAICIPGTQILIRNYVGSTLSWESAGYLEAMWRLSAAYLMVVTTTLSVYFIPSISELDEPKKIKAEVLKTFKVIVPFTIISSTLIYLLRHSLIRWLFSADFNGMEELFAWQMIGDTIKVSSWILMYLYVAKNFYRLYIFCEIFFSITFYLLVLVLESHLKLQAVPIAHAINYSFYFFLGVCALRQKKIL